MPGLQADRGPETRKVIVTRPCCDAQPSIVKCAAPFASTAFPCACPISSPINRIQRVPLMLRGVRATERTASWPGWRPVEGGMK